MAMIISKFHRLIESRLLWAVFLVVIVFSFVIWGTSMPGARRSGADVSPGRLEGKPVDAEEFRNAWQNEYVRLVLMVGRAPAVDQRMEEYLTQRAWRRLVSLREARRLGFNVGDEEVIAYIRSIPAFQNRGQFDVGRYQMFVRQALGPMGYSQTFLEEHIREELTLEKLRRMIEAATLVSPTDVELAMARLTDLLTIEYAVLPRSLVESELQPALDDARAFLEANPERYRLPPRVAVRAVFFPLDAYLERVPPIPEKELENFYDEHLSEFQTEAPAEGEGDEGERRRITLPLEAVRSDIEARLRRQAALQLALEDADAFWRRIAPFVTEHPLTFDEAARLLQLEIRSFGPFAETEPVAGFPPGSDFHRAAFSLRDNPDESFSHPIAAEDGYYILSLSERFPSRLPTFEEVADRVVNDLREKMIADALDACARQLAAAVREGTPLKELAEARGLAYEAPQSFSYMGPRPDLAEAEQMLDAAFAAKDGDMLEPIRIGTERVILARLIERRPGEADRIASLRPTVAESLRRQRAQQLFEAWQSSLLRRADFEDTSPRQRPPQEEDDET